MGEKALGIGGLIDGRNTALFIPPGLKKFKLMTGGKVVYRNG